MLLTYNIEEVVPYVNWLYFDHSWGMSGKPEADRMQLRHDAERMLEDISGSVMTKAVFDIFHANSEGDDIVVGTSCMDSHAEGVMTEFGNDSAIRLPMLRQQHPSADGHYLCMADFIRPAASGKADEMGVFVCSVPSEFVNERRDDCYEHLLAQTLADRLAEATAEKMHEEVRKKYWGYAHDERLTVEDLHNEKYQGIRPAVGYPSMPDTSVNFILSELVDFNSVGVRLTSSGMMMPHASVSGLMLKHPGAVYFSVGAIGEDQLADYASRRRLPVELVRRYIKPK